jgi:hypothetical protein
MNMDCGYKMFIIYLNEVSLPSQESGHVYVSLCYEFHLSFYDISIAFWNCSDSVVYFVYTYEMIYSSAALHRIWINRFHGYIVFSLLYPENSNNLIF